jgi:hypothetical protein
MISEQVSSSEKLSDKIDIAFILQETEIVHNERVLNAFKNFLFIFYVIYMLALYDVCLLHALDCILLVNLSLDPAHSYVTKSTFTKRSAESNVVKGTLNLVLYAS